MKNKAFNRHRTWRHTARWRRILLVGLILTTTLVASGYMANILPHRGRTGLEMVLVIFFGLLFAWISIGFWTALLGFYMLWRRFDRFAITNTLQAVPSSHIEGRRTAVLIPIYNENVPRVFAGIQTIYRSLAATGRMGSFDFFVLSDSTQPDAWVEEEVVWARVCAKLDAFGRLFYRHRRPNIKRKSGNVADFCRRWGKNYRYMIVLDADSVMTGDTLLKMVQLMDQNSRVGILQTVPMAVGRHSLIARVQQFSSHLYGPMFSAGLHFWQLGDAQYWGHNAIIRIAPFMAHCGLPRLLGKPPLGGEILSHDFVEAALMRGAGWGVWLAYNLGGSWEEPPPTLIDELARDRRWCQGNIQHMRLLLARQILFPHRILFLNGAMAYGSALLWFLFLSISTAKAVTQVIFGPDYFPIEGGLFPDWPVWNLGWALTLLTSTVIILFLPKIFSLILVVFKQKQARRFGGAWRLFLSVVAEVIVSMLLAPLRMLAHSKFVFITLLGRKVQWTPPPREDSDTGWRVALRFHGGGMLFALLWGMAIFMINRPFFWWLTPILIPLVLAVPISVWSSRASLGHIARRIGLFLIPEELSPPRELSSLNTCLTPISRSASPVMPDQRTWFVQAVVDPLINCLHRAFRRERRQVSDTIGHRRRQLVEKALTDGPQRLRREEKMELLSDPASLADLHQRIWELPGGETARRWGIDA
ncbi:MAG: glucans biosynthesis glucosyltransferase MdoH [Desulfosarcina sp.]